MIDSITATEEDVIATFVEVFENRPERIGITTRLRQSVTGT